ncbi:E3 ubiquitin-protein ligase SSM4 [Sugiyamaella lignohabitans]|uniref:RING-type E3 ubiquitin transferase n=1 Tax=Sugiyamaella lignohabitans TaxID=796027 RepID=A0A167ETK7_9ASCO|nr:E3 ubiquitin-protein ligase SSM4 [Sugiyamaella lignohabitans]ANB14436.1 E3 ubiquitin-protein ligase SSM4 [Sugiyamaella lignohabitans]
MDLTSPTKDQESPGYSDHGEPSSDTNSQSSLPQSSSINEHVEPPDDDTCRICRGEASEEEPLYHPCKCSGSIKYVHQDW